MAKFSDTPYFILSNYFTDEDNDIHKNLTSLDTNIPSTIIRNRIVPHNYHYPSSVSLRGAKSGIIAKYGFGVELYVKVEGTYYRIKATPISGTPIGNIFSFNYESDAYRFCELTIEDLIDNNGCEVYFKKDRQFNDYIDSNTDYTDYLNTNKLYYYIGKLYISATNRIDIVIDTFKDFVVNALPYNNRGSDKSKVVIDTANGYKYDVYNMLMARFLELYFDRVFSKNYNLLKNIWTLSDPAEVDFDYLYYISNMYDVNLLERITEKEQREYVSKLPDFLKRKGTYTSLFIIWKILTYNTLNYLNIYERWHDWDVIGSPLKYFDDYLYISYPSYNTLPPNEGAGAGYYYDAGVSLTYFIEPSTEWKVTHGYNEQFIFTEFINDNEQVIIPDSIYFTDSNNLVATFDTAVTGKVVTMTTDNNAYRYQFDQRTPLATWHINHNLGVKYPMAQVSSTDYSIVPNRIIFDDINNLSVYFDNPIDGSAVIGIDNQLYTYSTSAASSSWIVEHDLNTKYPIVQVVVDDMVEVPDEITFLDKNSLLITFSYEASGNAIVFDNTEIIEYPTYSKEVSGGLCLSPHYKVEMDLSREPLGTNFIINEDLITILISNFEKFRPVSRFSHYYELIAPITDFTGKNIPLYTGNYAAAMYSKCYQPILSSIEGNLVYASFSNSLAWIIKHDLNSTNIITQCFTLGQVMFEPKSIENIDANRIKITFATPTAGFAYLTVSEFTLEQASDAIQWTVTHGLNFDGDAEKWNIVQTDDVDRFKFLPLSIVADSQTEYLVNLAYSDSGFAYTATRFDTDLSRYVRDSASTTWNIYHGLNANAIQAQFYDEDGYIVYPKTFTIDNANSCTVVFGSSITGTAIIRKIGISPTDMTGIINNVTYAEVGYGTSGRKWNPESNHGMEKSYGQYPIVRRKSDNEFFYFEINVDDDRDMNIYEIGLFDINNNIVFYTYCDLIFKPDNVTFTIWYRVKKDMR